MFDPSQQIVIDADGGYHLVLAPPGCGKTQILTERIRKAHAAGVAYEDMLCLTFTNRAARGMIERINSNIDDADTQKIYVGNIHRYCSKFLFDNAVVAAETSIIDEDDSRSIIANYMNVDESMLATDYKKRQEFQKVVHMAALITQIESGQPKELRLHPETLTSDDVKAISDLCRAEKREFTPEALIDIYRKAEAYIDDLQYGTFTNEERQRLLPLLRCFVLAKSYADYKRENKLLDFEDLLITAYAAMTSDVQYKRYRWVQIDEVQDLNPMQLAIVDCLTDHEQPFTVMYLGDEQQAIFSFMGAKMSTLAMLKQRCEGNIHHLQQNHRSPKYLLDIFNTYAEKVLGIDPALLPTTEYAPQPEGNELVVRSYKEVEQETKEVAELVKRLADENPEQTTAILVSTNKDADAISSMLANKKLEHFKISGQDLFAKPEVKLLLAHVSILSNEFNFIAWARLLKGLCIFAQHSSARSFVNYLRQRAMTPVDMLVNADGTTYLQHFIKAYEEKEIVIFDTETTGLDVTQDAILQIAAVKIRGCKEVEGSRFNIFLETKREIPQMLGDIVNPIIEERKTATIVPNAEGLRAFMEYVGDDPLLGHNADYDYNILDYNLRRYCPGVNIPGGRNYFDSLRLIKLVRPELRQYKLKSLLEVLNLVGENAHLADADVDATRSLVVYCHDKGLEFLPEQRRIMQIPRMVRIGENMRRNYLQSYNEAKSKLYEANADSISQELTTFYEYCLKEKFIGQAIPCFAYITQFIDKEICDTASEPTLMAQLQAHGMEINTLKEADLCGCDIIRERIFVSTIHKAKGLEFDSVIVFDATDSHFPGYFAQQDKRKTDESARCFYVALSRTKRRLFIAWSENRADFHHNLTPQPITRFMKPIAHFFNTFTSIANDRKGNGAIF